MRFQVKAPPIGRTLTRAATAYQRNLRRAAIYATDRASKEYQRALQDKIQAVGLGRLSAAVGHTSMKREGGANSNDRPYGVIFARGGDESQSGGALEAYSQGAYITAQRGQWLAFATDAVPKFVSIGGRRFRTTPELYRASSLVSSIGPLEFRPLGNGRAVLVVKNVSLSPKTGRAKAQRGKTRTRIPQKEVIAFVLIKVTLRAKRFDKDRMAYTFSQRVPGYMRDHLAQSRTGE